MPLSPQAQLAGGYRVQLSPSGNIYRPEKLLGLFSQRPGGTVERAPNTTTFIRSGAVTEPTPLELTVVFDSSGRNTNLQNASELVRLGVASTSIGVYTAAMSFLTSRQIYRCTAASNEGFGADYFRVTLRFEAA